MDAVVIHAVQFMSVKNGRTDCAKTGQSTVQIMRIAGANQVLKYTANRKLLYIMKDIDDATDNR